MADNKDSAFVKLYKDFQAVRKMQQIDKYTRKIERLQYRIKRLEEALDA